MSSRDWQFRIQDMLSAVRAIQKYTEGMTFDQFLEDEKTMDAVVHRILIIGEAAGHIPEQIALLSPEIKWQEIRGMRNIIVHEYFGVSEKIIWDTIHEDLPGIIGPLSLLLDASDS